MELIVNKFVRSALVMIATLAAVPAFAQSGGNEPKSGKTSQDGFTVIDLTSPISGVETSRTRIRAFQVYSTNQSGAYLTLKIFRPIPLGGELVRYQHVGSSNLERVFSGRIQTFFCDIPVANGDLVGFSTLDLGSGAIDYDDSDPSKAGSIAYQGDVGTVHKADGSILPYVRAIRVLGIPSADVPVSFRTSAYVPVVTRAVGTNGTLFRTEGIIYNPSDSVSPADKFDIVFVPTGTEGTVVDGVEKGITKSIDIKGKDTWRVNDLLKDIFGLDSGTGFLKIKTALVLESRWRIVNETPTGSFGQDVPIVSFSEGLIYDTQVLSPTGASFQLIGAEETTARRTNFGVLNLSAAEELEFIVEPFDGDGTSMAPAKTFKAPKLGHVQWNRFLTTELGLADGVQKVRLVVSPNDKFKTARLFCYLSIIDNVSEDPIFVRGAKMSSLQ